MRVNGKIITEQTDPFDLFDRYDELAGDDHPDASEANQLIRDVWAMASAAGEEWGFEVGLVEGKREAWQNAYCATVDDHEHEVENTYGEDLASIDELIRFARTILNGGSVHEATMDLPAHLILGWKRAA